MSKARPLIGTGQVWHRRLRPAHNEFSYRSFFLLLPMRSLRSEPCQALRRNRFGLLSFHDRDHGDGRDDALAWFDDLLAAEGIADARGEVWLHTYPRVLGHVFNPVSFWYALREDGSLAAVLAEVNNTFGERHCYLLSGPRLRWGANMEADKVFHVSPFCSVEGRYRFRFLMAGDRPQAPEHTVVRVDHDDTSGPLLQTAISGALQPLTEASARSAFMRSPLHSLGVLTRIHWQALKLAFKRVPFHRQPPAPERFVTR
jgi:DUF1365 family protein